MKRRMATQFPSSDEQSVLTQETVSRTERDMYTGLDKKVLVVDRRWAMIGIFGGRMAFSRRVGLFSGGRGAYGGQSRKEIDGDLRFGS